MAEQMRLERQNGMITGVCGGIAARFGGAPSVFA
jgi:phage shock protein PspC (stress-responsive transcriptional regulator)